MNVTELGVGTLDKWMPETSRNKCQRSPERTGGDFMKTAKDVN